MGTSRRFQLQADNCEGLKIVQPKHSRDALTRIETNWKKKMQITQQKREETNSAETTDV